MINKKAQLSIFVIIGIAIVLFTILFLIVQFKIIKFDNIPADIRPINEFVSSCVEKSSEEAVYYIGDSGGYYVLPNLSTDNNIAYYFYEKKNYMPSQETIEKELANFMNEDLFLCTRNFIDFPDYNIRSLGINTSVEIKENKVLFNVKYPLSIEKDNKTYALNNFNSEVLIPLGKIYKSIKKIIDDQMKSEDICVDCLSDVATENNLYINLMDYNDSIIFSVYEKNSTINGEDYVFYFANKY